MNFNLILNKSTSNPIKAGDNINMTCRAEIDKTLIDVNIDVEVYLFGPGGSSTSEWFNSSNLTLHQTSIPFSSISAEDSGLYKCNATIKASSDRYFLNPRYKEEYLDLILSEFLSLYC